MSDATYDHTDNAVLAAVVARWEIEAALLNFLHGLDDNEPDRWLAAFHDDAVLVLGADAVFTGHAEILNAAQPLWSLEHTTHLVGNTMIDLVDDARGTVLSRGVGIFQQPDGQFMVKSVRIEDRVTKKAGHWKLAHRTVETVSQFTVGSGDDARLVGVLAAT